MLEGPEAPGVAGDLVSSDPRIESLRASAAPLRSRSPRLVPSDPRVGPFESQPDHREESCGLITSHGGTWRPLFDEEDAVAHGRRTDKVFRAIKNDIAGWTPLLRDRKIDQLASVIAGMNNGNGPDLLGVCEVENRFVVEQLVDSVNATLATPRSYVVVHANTDDARGIDVAFIYAQMFFRVPLPLQESVFLQVVMRRDATREIVEVNFKSTTTATRTYWYSVTTGPATAAAVRVRGNRAIAGETRGYFHQRVYDVHGPGTLVLAMGNFNDEPFDASLVRHALSTR
jgi:hypothetical protein